MAFPVKQVRTLEERLRIIEEVGKKPSKKRIDVAKQLGLPPSTLNRIIVKRKKTKEHAYMSVDQELATCDVLCVEEMCGALGSGSFVEEEVVVVVVVVVVAVAVAVAAAVVVMMMKPSFTEALHVFESMRAFMYAHDITERDQANIVNIESLLFKSIIFWDMTPCSP
jgi:hypothetical protein